MPLSGIARRAASSAHSENAKIRSGIAETARHVWILAPLIAAMPAAAQQATTGLPSREQVALTAPTPQSSAPPKVTIEDRSARPPCELAGGDDPIDVRRAEFGSADGRALPPDIRTLLAAVQPTPGPQPIASLCDLRDRAAETLREAGYIAAVSIPPQDIEAGSAHFEIILAHFQDVQITGKPGRYARRLASRIREIKALRPVNRYVLERMLLAIDDIPGLSITLTLRSAGTEAGAIVGDLAVDYDPVTLVASIDNFASKAIGPAMATSRIEANGLTGLSDRSYLGISTTVGSDEQKLIQVGHYFGNGRRMSGGGRFSYARTRPDLLGLDIRSESMIGGIDITRQLLRSPDHDLALTAGLDIINQEVRLRFAGLNLLLSRDKLRVAYARFSGNAQIGRHAINGQVELRHGLNILGASPSGSDTTSRRNGDTTATVVRATIEDVITFTPLFSVAATIDGQWGSGALLGFEQYAIGNYTIGRGFDPGSASGDRALGVRIEPRLELGPGGDLRPQLFAFIDHVRTWSVGLVKGGEFTSFGGGFRLVAPSVFAIDAIYARRSTKNDVALGTSTASDRLLGSFAFRF